MQLLNVRVIHAIHYPEFRRIGHLRALVTEVVKAINHKLPPEEEKH
jgi:predicted acetyltransferase